MTFCMRTLTRLHQEPASSKLAAVTNLRMFFKYCRVHNRPHSTPIRANWKPARLCTADRTGGVGTVHEACRHVSTRRTSSQTSRTLSKISHSCSALSVPSSESPKTGRLLQMQSSHFGERRLGAAVISPVSSASDKTSQVQVDLDLETRLSAENLDSLQNNLSARGLGFSLEELVADFQHWKELTGLKTALEGERTDVAKMMASLVKGKISEEKVAEKEKLTMRGKALKEQLKDIMPSWWNAEQKVMMQALQLPTDLHPLTPLKEDQLVEHCKGTAGDPGCTNHVDFAEQLGLLKFSNVGPKAVYLLGETAELEQSLLHSAALCLRERGYSPIAAPEIFRSLVVDSCGLDSEEVLCLREKEEGRETSGYCLKGNSLLSYAAFLTRIQVNRERLPVRMYSIGRHYAPQTGGGLPGLYGPVQSNRVTLFSGDTCREGATDAHNAMVAAAWHLIQGLRLPARKVRVCAGKLSPSESLRTELQIWAPGLQCFVPMGCVSIHDDYVSRRLMSRSSSGEPLYMVSGVAMDTAVVVASVLEHSYTQGEFQLMSMPGLTDSRSG